MNISELLERWDSGEGKPYKGSLIDWDAYEDAPDDIGCMCAQGQVLHILGGWEPARIKNIGGQSKADAETAKLLNISRAHAVLLRNVNDKQDGAPSIVLTEPGQVLGGQWRKLLDFWWAFGQFSAAERKKVAAARAAAGVAARAAAGAAAWAAAGAAAGAAARAAAWAAAGAAAWAAARAAAGEIQSFEVLTSRGRDCFFLPMFGWQTPAEIPARPADYGLGVVPA